MKRSLLLQFVFIGALFIGNVSAQNTPTDDSPDTNGRVSNNDFWTGIISNDEVYVIELNKIANVSRQRYMLNGLIVREVVIDTIGNTVARFYHIEPLKGGEANPITGVLNQAQEFAETAADITGIKDVTGVDPQRMVVKQYPETTHAKTVEYRIASKATIRALFDSVNDSWQNRKRETFRVE